VPQGHYLGLAFPDPDLTFDAQSGHWAFGAIDWSEFKRVLAGDGPCNRERLAARRKAHDEGAWVRAAALAHAKKRAKKRAEDQAKNHAKNRAERAREAQTAAE